MFTTNLKQFRQGLVPIGNPQGGLIDSQEIVPIKAVSRIWYNNFGQSSNISMLTSFDWFELLPAASVAAGSDKLVTLIGSNTPVAAQSTTGGASFTTGATTTNQAGIAGVASTGFAAPITATNQLIFRSRVNLASLLTMYASMGLNSTVTDINPVTDGAEGACFLADPTNSLTASTGATNAQALNWILVTSVATVLTYTFTNIPIVALQDTVLDIILNPNLTWSFFINGVLAGTPAAVATSGTVVKVIGGVRTTANATAAMTMRFVSLERTIG